MKLLINLCSHDGIVSHYNGIGTMTDRYIRALNQFLLDSDIEYDVNLITPRYNIDSFGYSSNFNKLHKYEKFKIIMIENGSNGKVNYGNINQWVLLCENTANFINNIDKTSYDKIITIYNDTPFANLAYYLDLAMNHLTVWIPHSTVKIHKVDSALKKQDDNYYNVRLNWELCSINFINHTKNCYVGVIGKYIKKHLIFNYNLKINKTIKIFNGELLSDELKINNIKKCKELYKKIEHYNSIMISFSRAENYKNLEATMELGFKMGIQTVVIAQSYYKNQSIINEYEQCAKKNNINLYIDPPFDFPWYILHNFKNKIIVVIPSKKEVMGLIINEVRKLNKNNILIVSNNINGLKEQITDTKDGVLVDMNNISQTANKISRYFNEEKMQILNKNSWCKLKNKYNLETNFNNFMFHLINKKI